MSIENIQEKLPKPNKRYWLASADMGYGHQRAIYPLADIAEEGEIITIGSLSSNSAAEQKLWNRMLRMYEGFSRATSIPFFGKTIFGLLDSLLYIPSYYPIRNLSGATLQVKLLTSSIKKGLCAGFLEKIKNKHLPIITSFFAPAIAADMAGHDEIYCIICDADLNRVWVAEQPWESRIKYFAPCGKAAQRLRSYGVPENRIFITGFPLPHSLIGGTDMPLLKRDLAQRLANLDPRGRFRVRNEKSIEHFLGIEALSVEPLSYLTITYAVGGAGAQKEIGSVLMKSLKEKIHSGHVHLNLVAGIREDVFRYFHDEAKKILGDSELVKIIYSDSMHEYFEEFNNAIRTTDILWTKPSELSFYTGLGLPIIMSPALGSQEQFNKYWLFDITSGIKQLTPEYTDHWLFDFINKGRMADAAWDGFLKARKLGNYKIREILETGMMSTSDSPLMR